MRSGNSWFSQQNQVDFAEIDFLDPALKEGHRVIYDRVLSVSIKFQDKYSDLQDIPQPENLLFRILLLGTDTNPQSVRIEISSDKDLFFIFQHEATTNSFNQIKVSQGLQLPFKDYPGVIISTLNKVETNFSGYQATFVIMLDGSARLEIYQTTEYKSISMINFDFHACDEHFLRQTIIFKYNQQRKTIKNLQQQVSQGKYTK
ncbi:hypothetical protein pb186bvf_001136 [Paramecium bursaria]